MGFDIEVYFPIYSHEKKLEIKAVPYESPCQESHVYVTLFRSPPFGI